MRLKHASPSVTGSAASIASMRAITSATVVTGTCGAGRPADMTLTIRSPGPHPPGSRQPITEAPATDNTRSHESEVAHSRYRTTKALRTDSRASGAARADAGAL